MRRYLLLDDNLPFAENLAEIIGDSGDEVRFSDSGEEALQWVTRERFDAVVTDMRMPALSGASFLHRVRLLDPDLPAIAVTAFTGDDDLERARTEGLLAVFGKPVPVDALLKLLSRARRGGLVALVEDDEALADNLSEALSSIGFSVVTARSVLETEALVRLRPFAGIADLRVPGGEDGEALARLRERFPQLPIVAISGTGVTPPEPVRRVLRKPFATSELLSLLDRLFREVRA